jgi:site-specific DNA-methyltransferase (adenine-specific)
MNSDCKLLRGDCSDVLKDVESLSVDLTVTSPPYDSLRAYEGLPFDKFKLVAEELFRVTKPGGIVVWVVGDGTEKGSETGSSFKQALYFKECGFNIHDTMIYEKSCFSFPMNTRYHQLFEYMFVFSKGSPKTFNPIKDRPNKYAGKRLTSTERQKDGTLRPISERDAAKTFADFSMRWNIWRYKVGSGHMGEPGLEHTHPAMFPLPLAQDHIRSWSNEGDTVLDPFMGSGTTGVACRILNREFIGIELDAGYFGIAKRRIDSCNLQAEFK